MNVKHRLIRSILDFCSVFIFVVGTCFHSWHFASVRVRNCFLKFCNLSDSVKIPEDLVGKLLKC